MKWLKFKWGNLKRRWRLAMDGENAILTGIDAIYVAHEHIDYMMSTTDIRDTRAHLVVAMKHLKRAIDYQDEPEPVYPDEEHEANGLLHVVPKDFRQQENA